MKKSLFYLSVLFLIGACAPSPEKQARDLLTKSIEAHGGQPAWKSIQVLEFEKWTKILQEDGTIESELNQKHEFRFKPFFEGKISWTTDSVEHVITFDGANVNYFMGGNEVKNVGFLASKKKEFEAAYYTVAQPWKLLDEGGNLYYEGKKTLENGREVESIRVDYGPESDTWWYYFDPKSFLMVASEVQLKDHRSMVYDLSVAEVEGLKLHGTRESWRVDEQGKRLFLRAEYRYSDYKITR